MRTRVIVFLAFLCAALPLYAGEDQSDNSSSGATLTLETDNPEVISSFSWGIGAALRSDQGGGGAVFKELTLTKILSNSSKKLFEHCAAGTHFKEVVIHISRKGNGKQDYLKITMSDVLVSSYQVGGVDVPTETISLTYARIDYSILIGQ